MTEEQIVLLLACKFGIGLLCEAIYIIAVKWLTLFYTAICTEEVP